MLASVSLTTLTLRSLSPAVKSSFLALPSASHFPASELVASPRLRELAVSIYSDPLRRCSVRSAVAFPPVSFCE